MRDHPETICFYRKRLPHWEVADGRYFVTIRLKGAIPEAGMRRVRELRTRYDEAVANGQTGLEERRAVFREMEHWLERAPTVDHLTQPKVARMVVDAIEHREREGLWTVYSYALMPNHIHLFFAVGTLSTPAVGTPSAPASVCFRGPDSAPTGQSPGSAHLRGTPHPSAVGTPSSAAAAESVCPDDAPTLSSSAHLLRPRVSFDANGIATVGAWLQSYFGHFKLANTHRLKDGIFRKHPFLDDWFALENGALRERFPAPRGCTRYLSQVAWYRKRLPRAVLAVQRGDGFEIFPADRSQFQELDFLGVARMVPPSGVPTLAERLGLVRLPVAWITRSSNHNGFVYERTLKEIWL